MHRFFSVKGSSMLLLLLLQLSLDIQRLRDTGLQQEEYRYTTEYEILCESL